MSKIDDTLSANESGFNYAESILSAYAPQFGIPIETATQMAPALGAGHGRTAEGCGAFSGACITLGLHNGRTDPEDLEAKERTYEAVRECGEKFRAEVGSIQCRELPGWDISTLKGLEYARGFDLFKPVCPNVSKLQLKRLRKCCKATNVCFNFYGRRLIKTKGV